MNPNTKPGRAVQTGRDFMFDNMKALLIYAVIQGHFFKVNGDFSISSPSGVLYIFSFTFIMEGFLFVSGFFSQNVSKCRRTAVEMFLFPYILLMPIMYLVRLVLNGYAEMDYLVPTMALWYLLVMLYYRVAIGFLARIPHILPISFVVALAAGMIPFLDETLALGRTFAFLPFFLIGFYIKKEQIARIRRLPKGIFWGLAALLVGFCIVMAYTRFMPVSVLYMKDCYYAYNMSWYTGLLARVVSMTVAAGWIFVFLGLVPGRETPASKVGRNTMSVYILHIFVRYTIQRFGLPGADSVLIYVITIGVSILTVWLFSRDPVAKGYQACLDWLWQWPAKAGRWLVHKL